MNIIKNENHYLKALNSKLIVDMPHIEAQTKIVDILTQLYFDNGRVITAKELILLSGGVINEVKRYFQRLKIEELELCFNNGIRGEYGEFFGLNIVTFHKWIKAFLIEDKRVEAMKLKNTPQIEAKKESTQDELKQGRLDYIVAAKGWYFNPNKVNKSDRFGSFGTNIELLYNNMVEFEQLKADNYLDNLEKAHEILDYEYEQMAHSDDREARKIANINRPKLNKDSKQVINQAKQITIENLWNN